MKLATKISIVVLLCISIWISSSFYRSEVALTASKDAIFVANFANDKSRIYKLNPAIQGLTPFTMNFDMLTLGVCGPDGMLYFAERPARRIIKISQDGQKLSVVYQQEGLHASRSWNAPEGPSFDEQGNLYFTNVYQGGVWRIEGAHPRNPAVQIVKLFSEGATRFVEGAGTAVLHAYPYEGHVLVAHYGLNVVYKIAPEDFCDEYQTEDCGIPQPFLTEEIRHPYGITVNSFGEIYVSNTPETGENYIAKFSSDGEFIEKYSTGSDATGMAVDSDDNVWYASGWGLFKLTPSGEQSYMTAVPPFSAGVAVCKAY